MKTILKILFLFLSINITFASSEIKEYSNFSEVQTLAQNLAKKTQPKSIWLVYDIDNTLLTGVNPLARTEWFDWQLKMVQNNSHSRYRTATTIDNLVAEQIKIFDHSHMIPIEKDTTAIVNSLQKDGFHSMILTARTAVGSDAIFRELKNNHLIFSKSSKPLKPQSTYSMKLEYPVIFDHGIMMTSGQNKGLLLQHLFHDQHINAKDIIFVDDSKKNVENVAKAFANDDNYHVISVLYTHAQPEVSKFENYVAGLPRYR